MSTCISQLAVLVEQFLVLEFAACVIQASVHDFEYSLLVWQGIMTSQLSSLLFLVVGLSMALTPWLAAGGQAVASRFEQQDVRSLLPAENEVRSRKVLSTYCPQIEQANHHPMCDWSTLS